MKVSSIMHKGATNIAPSTTVSSIAKIMKSENVGALPVVENGRLVGIVTDRDIVLQALADGGDASTMTARQVMTANVISCHEADDSDSAVQLMEEHRVRRLPVLDKAGHLVGMVSVVDLSNRMPADIAAEVLSAVSHYPKALSA